VCADFVLSSKVVLIRLEIAGEVLLGLGMAEKNRFTSTHWLTLSFKTVVRIARINNPDSVI
jgi:hypothetical protein